MSEDSFKSYIQYETLPDFVIDGNGLRVYLNSDVWILNTAGRGNNLINISRVKNEYFRYVISKYLIFSIERLAPITVLNIANILFTQFSKVGLVDENFNFNNSLELEDKLIQAINKTLSDLRKLNKLDQFYYMTRWYMWCVDYLEYGFSEEYALFLSRIKIPGNIKGQSVRSQDPNEGPLNFELEEPLVRRALLDDSSDVFTHKQQRLAVALCLAFGRNPLNFVRLREEDFWNFAKDFREMDELWQLNIPRIKKRNNPRVLFRTETCQKKLADLINDLLTTNSKYSTSIGLKSLPRPIFMRITPNLKLKGTDSEDYSFHITSEYFYGLVVGWAVRMKIYSPITNKILHLTPRRLRYTFACNMARQGVSRAALAEMLDHSDTQHVCVYFELFDELVGMLDKALASKIGKIIGLFKGEVIADYSLAINGENLNKHLIFVDENNPNDNFKIGVCGQSSLCHLDPPYSCYLCPKFQPYQFADHDRVLSILLEGRDERLKKYEQARLAIQLDDVIYAVGEVSALCKQS